LSSLASVFGPRSIGIILSGMGSDGVTGMRNIKKAGGVTIAQDEKTSVVFGMPKVAIDDGCIDIILPLEDIYGVMVRLMSLEKTEGVFRKK
jgi:two-component system chemotaxis response regulator CheB